MYFKNLFFENQKIITIFTIGLLLIGFGIFLVLSGAFESTKIEIIDTAKDESATKQVVAEVAGAVEKPGVYKLEKESRIENLLIAAGGLSETADRAWVEQNINRAAKVLDGQKIYIPKTGEAGGYSADIPGTSTGLINVNTASKGQLESLPGIGPVRAQTIIDNRPYSAVDELRIKKIIPSNIYEDIKEKITAP